MSSDYIIELKDVWKKYSKREIFHRSIREDIINILSLKKNHNELKEDEFWALKRFNLKVKNGECVGLYGPNGSGKSTILKLIANITYPTKGNIIVQQKPAPLIEIGAGFHPDLTGRENIFMNGTILGMGIKDIRKKLDSIIGFSEIKEFIDMPVKKYSSGMYLRLAFSIAIYSEADIFLFDEILAVGDEDFREKCTDKIYQLKSRGKTMIIVTHDRKLMEKIADRIVFMEKGEIRGEINAVA